MSRDDGVRLRQLPDSNWIAYRYSASVDETPEKVNSILADLSRFKQYRTLENAIEAYKDLAQETEYGFDIVPLMPPAHPLHEEPEPSFGQELRHLLNRYSKENASGTPDHILARFLERQLWIFEETVQARASWRGESIEPPGGLMGVKEFHKRRAGS